MKTFARILCWPIALGVALLWFIAWLLWAGAFSVYRATEITVDFTGWVVECMMHFLAGDSPED